MAKGKLIRLKIGNDFVPCEMSCDITVNQEVLQVTNNTNGRAKSYIAGYYDWQVSLESKFVVSDTTASSQVILDRILNDLGAVGLEIISVDSNGAPYILKGDGIPVQWNLNAGSTGDATNNVVFQGSGELTQDYELYWNIINAMPINDDKPNIIKW